MWSSAVHLFLTFPDVSHVFKKCRPSLNDRDLTLRTLQYLTKIICKVDRESFSIKPSLQTKLGADLWNTPAEGNKREYFDISGWNHNLYGFILGVSDYKVKLKFFLKIKVNKTSKQPAIISLLKCGTEMALTFLLLTIKPEIVHSDSFQKTCWSKQLHSSKC